MVNKLKRLLRRTHTKNFNQENSNRIRRARNGRRGGIQGLGKPDREGRKAAA
jgi:hypothetical protein